MRVREYAVVRQKGKRTSRLCWRPEADAELYCGICMRATVQPVMNETCPACESRVERVLEVLDGGKARH